MIHKPDGSEARLAGDATSFPKPISLAFIRIGDGADEQRFAVNLAASESNTAPLELEQLEQMGVRRGASLTRAEQLDRIRQQRDTELESHQKIWRWLLIGALGVLVLETAWAGRATRQITKAELLA